jgi:D-glycero-D-manno-heptose 1,7-bisphosphate phosphatase
MYPAIFLDRDGVIIENRPAYVRSWADVEVFPEALAALARIRNHPYKIVMVTNQSGVGRGLIPAATVDEINRRLLSAVEAAGGHIDAVFTCPHRPEDACDCRKPQPGLLLQAAKALSLDLGRSIMIGDALSDLRAGQAAGVKKLALVKTGRGAKQALLPASDLVPFLVCETLGDALSALLPIDL